MRITWWVGILWLWLIGQAISATLEVVNIISGTTTSALYTLMRPQFTEFTNPLTFIVGVFQIIWTWLQIIWMAFWWNYSFLTGDWQFLQYAGWCISIAMIISLVLALRGTPSG